MADNKTEEPGLLESALAFIRGETVPKSLVLIAEARSVQLTADNSAKDLRIKELEASAAESIKANETNLKQVTDLTAQVKVASERISLLESEAVTSARGAAKILSNMGIAPIGNTSTTGRDTADGKLFSELVSDQVKTGKTKADSVRFCIQNFPNEYAKAKNLGISSL